MKMQYSEEIIALLHDIEVSETDFQKAVNRYESVSEYICEFYPQMNTEIILQGSFKLGTAVKPLTEDGSYDIDTICIFYGYSKGDITQEQLKLKLGEAVKKYAESTGMKNDPKDGNRCWTMEYVDDHNFHMDILPAIPNGSLQENEIAFTDKRDPRYKIITEGWEVSNPKDYYSWFIHIANFEAYKSRFAQMINESVERIPDYKVKTPLQRVIQLYKRHAEVMFENKIEYKPSSVIITTLTAHAYKNIAGTVHDFVELATAIADMLPLYLDNVNGKKCVLNPVNKNEDLSFKWQKDDRYYKYFLDWVEQLKSDFGCKSLNESVENRFRRLRYSMFSNAEQLKKNTFLRTTDLPSELMSLPYHQKPKWQMSNSQVVIINAYWSIKGKWHSLKSGESVPKYVDLKFQIDTQTPKKFDIFWQITNTGAEAEQAQCLRGDFYRSDVTDKGERIRQESTRYYGTHYVEAFIVKNGICYGRSDPFLVVIK